MKFMINVIPHSNQRYNTCGDWQYDKKSDTLFIDVSETNVEAYNFLIAIHELVEACLCIRNQIPQELVDKFDQGVGAELNEPGNDIRAPYYKQHGIASGIERMLAGHMGVDWNFFEELITKMGEEYNPPPKDSSEKAP
jgi:hypothetical protein